MAQGYARYWLAHAISRAFPPGGNLWMAERLADAYWDLAVTERAAIRSNLAAILGRPIDDDSPMVREVFRGFGRYLAEFFVADRLTPSQLVIEGLDALAGVLPPRQGAIVLTAHLGNWELGAISLHRAGYAVSAVALPHENPRVNALFDRQRRRCGVEVVPLGLGAGSRCLEALRSGRLLGIAGDREFGRNGIRVDFLGRSTVLPRGPATLSLRARAPVVPMFLVREGPWRFRFHVEPPILPERATVEQLTQRYAAAIERHVRRFPEQWIVF